MYRNYVLIAILTIVIIIFGIYYVIGRLERNRCYNLPLNQYVEDTICSKYTFEDYIKESE